MSKSRLCLQSMSKNSTSLYAFTVINNEREYFVPRLVSKEKDKVVGMELICDIFFAHALLIVHMNKY